MIFIPQCGQIIPFLTAEIMPHGKNIAPLTIFPRYHPLLIEEWKIFAESIGIKFTKYRKVLITSDFKSIINFLKIGGFILGVKAGGNSRYFKGIPKNKILFSILEYYYRLSKVGKYLEKSSSEINKKIREIIDNKEFKSDNFYIKYLSNIVKTIKNEKNIH